MNRFVIKMIEFLLLGTTYSSYRVPVRAGFQWGWDFSTLDSRVRGAVKIVLEDVLRVRMVYVAIYLNIDYASG